MPSIRSAGSEAVQHWEEPHGAAAFFGVHERYGASWREGTCRCS